MFNSFSCILEFAHTLSEVQRKAQILVMILQAEAYPLSLLQWDLQWDLGRPYPGRTLWTKQTAVIIGSNITEGVENLPSVVLF